MFLFIIPALFIYFVGGFVLCVFLGIFFARKISILLGIFVFFTSFAQLYGNEIYANRQWKTICKEAGSHVYRQVYVNGFMHGNEITSEEAKRYMTSYGYKYVEGVEVRYYRLNKIEALYRYSLDKNGEIIREAISEPISKFVYRWESNKYITPYIYRSRIEVADIKTGELLGVDQSFATRGGIVMRWLTKNFFGDDVGSAQSCRGIDRSNILMSTLLPETTLEVEK